MGLRRSSTISIFLLVVVLLLNSTPVFARSQESESGSGDGRGGKWLNFLRPDEYYPSEATFSISAETVTNNDRDVEKDLFADALFQFVTSVVTGNANVISGVFVDGVLAMPVVQQPTGSAAFVSTQAGVVTQFALAAKYGTVGILAHNFLAGASFYSLSTGQDVYVVYGDGTTKHYLVTEIRRFQALQPYSAYSEFLDLDNNNTYYTATDLFYAVYARSDTLVFQTCIAANGIDSWGRYFVIAEQVS